MTSPCVRVRALTEDDRAAWDPLWQGYLDFYEEPLPPAKTERTWQRLMDPLVDLHGLCAVDAAGRLVGISHHLFHVSTWAIGPYCYLEDLYAHPDARGTGVGRALIEAVYTDADARGAERIYWATEELNETARRLYDRLARLTPFVQYAR